MGLEAPLHLQVVRNARHDGPGAEEESALDQEGSLVVEQVMPPTPRDELGQDQGDHLSPFALLDLVDVGPEGLEDRPVWRVEDD